MAGWAFLIHTAGLAAPVVTDLIECATRRGATQPALALVSPRRLTHSPDTKQTVRAGARHVGEFATLRRAIAGAADESRRAVKAIHAGLTDTAPPPMTDITRLSIHHRSANSLSFRALGCLRCVSAVFILIAFGITVLGVGEA